LGENQDYFLADTIEDCSAPPPDILLEEVNNFETVSRWLESPSANERKNQDAFRAPGHWTA
jgi:hypothetical protein